MGSKERVTLVASAGSGLLLWLSNCGSFQFCLLIVAHADVAAADIGLARVVVGFGVVGFGLAGVVVGSDVADFDLALVMGESVGALGLAVFGSGWLWVVAWLWLWMEVSI